MIVHKKKRYFKNYIFFEVQTGTSKYSGVSWDKNSKKWVVRLRYKENMHYGGYFNVEENAAMKVNLLCDEHEIDRKNPTINIDPDEIQQVIYSLSIVH